MPSIISVDIENLKSPDPAVYNEAFESLVSSRSDAMPALVDFLAEKKRLNRPLAAAAIATIADKSYADVITQYINDDDDKVRAWSAVALKRMDDSRALQALLKTIDDYPDEAHTDQTLSTYALIQWGEVVLMPVLNLLNVANWETRRHAFSVLKKIVFNKVGTKDEWERIWKENGSYDSNAEVQVRVIAIEKRGKWVKQFMNK